MLPGGHGFLRCFRQSVCGQYGIAAIGQDLAALLNVCTGQANHQRHPHLHLAERLDDALGYPVASIDTGKDIDQDRFHAFVGKHQVEGLGHPFRRSTATDVEEVGGLAAGQLDHVHRCHGQAGAIDDAADRPFKAHVGKATVGGAGFARVLLRLIPQLGDLRPPEERVVIESHFGVQRQHAAIGGKDQGIDLHHDRVKLAKCLVAAEQGLDGLRHLCCSEAEREGDFPRLEGLHADRGLDRHAHQGVGLLLANFLDFHAAGGRGYDHDPLALPVEDKSDVELALDLAGSLDIEPVDAFAARPSLMGDQALAEQIVGRVPNLVLGATELDTAGLAARARMNLGLDHPGFAADFARPIGGLLGAIGKPPTRHGHPEPGEDFLGLIFMDIH